MLAKKNGGEMNPEIERLNDHIDRMQSGKSPLAVETAGGTMVYYDANHIWLLQLAAQLAALRPGAAQPDPAFVSRLRKRVLMEVAGS
jgi:hypothetical protein